MINIFFLIGLYYSHVKGVVSSDPTEVTFDFVNDDRLRFGEYIDQPHITNFFPSSPFLCLKECARRSPCDYIVFRRSTLTCYLLQKSSSILKDDDYISSDPNYWNSTVDWFGECSNSNCNGTSICISSPRSGQQCLGYKCAGGPSQPNLLSVEGNQIGDRAVYTCPGTYELYQNTSAYCLPAGFWSPPSNCAHCGDPPAVNNSILQEPITHQQNDVVWYTCPGSYQVQQNISSTCQGGGEWTTPTYCKHCGDPPFVNNSVLVEPISHLEGAEIRYLCPGSYLDDQNITSTCQSNTVWTQPSSCKHCGDPPENMGGVITQPIFHLEDEIIEYTCPGAYITVQNITSTCQSDNTWTPVENCSHCGDPPFVNNSVLVEPISQLEGEEIRYLCPEAYLDDQNITSTCQSNGTWTKPNACKHCGPPPSPAGGELLGDILHELGEVIVFRCTNSYNQSQEVTSTCLVDGEWSTTPDCKHCGDPPFLNNSYVVEPISHLEGAETRYLCPEAYSDDQNITSTCQSNGTWTTPNACKYCGEPPHEGLVSQPLNYLEGDVVYYDCGAHNASSICQSDKEWSQYQCSTGVGCNPPTPTSSNAIPQTTSLFYAPNEEITYNCTGYEMPFFAKSICYENGSWSEPKCSIDLNNCQDLQNCNANYTDGDYWLFPDTILNSAAKIYCHNLDTTSPGEYISLPPNNIVMVPDIEQTYPPCNFVANSAFNITQFFKVRLDIAKFSITKGDFTFTSMSAPNLTDNYGEGRGCSYTTADVGDNCPPKGYFYLNLTDTGLKIESSENDWRGSGNFVSCTVNATSETEYLGLVDGYCGKCTISLLRVRDRAGMIPESLATVPTCSSNA